MTKERPTSQEMDFSDLIETTIQIMTLRGGPTSGNWAHGGRKGKRGGSGKGGGFKRIGVKGGKKGAKKLGRKGIKRSSRQTRVKDERGKQPKKGVKKGVKIGGVSLKNYSKTNTNDLQEMKKVANDIDKSIKLTFTPATAAKRVKDAKIPGQASKHFKELVSSYYETMANKWLDDNGEKGLPKKFDEWDNVAGAAKAHVMDMAGIKVNLHNGFFTTDTFL